MFVIVTFNILEYLLQYWIFMLHIYSIMLVQLERSFKMQMHHNTSWFTWIHKTSSGILILYYVPFNLHVKYIVYFDIFFNLATTNQFSEWNKNYVHHGSYQAAVWLYGFVMNLLAAYFGTKHHQDKLTC